MACWAGFQLNRVREVRGAFFNSKEFASLWAPLSAADAHAGDGGAQGRGACGGPRSGLLFMYRSSDGLGKWLVTDRESDFAENKGWAPIRVV